jgi:hypothetical protein
MKRNIQKRSRPAIFDSTLSEQASSFNYDDWRLFVHLIQDLYGGTHAADTNGIRILSDRDPSGKSSSTGCPLPPDLRSLHPHHRQFESLVFPLNASDTVHALLLAD